MTALELADKLIASPCEYADDAAAELRRLADLERDAARYRWLRYQHWSESEMCVVSQPKKAVVLGYDCPQMERLDAAIDAAMGEAK